VGLKLKKVINTRYIRNWELVKIPRANLYKWNTPNSKFGNTVHYEEIDDWCKQHIPNDVWTSMIAHNGVKHFYFKDPKYVTMFTLRWR